MERNYDEAFEDVSDQRVREWESAWPGRSNHREFSRMGVTFRDGAGLGQMLSNLLAKGLTHGDPSSSFEVRAGTSVSRFEISITNQGATIPPEVVKH